VGVNHGHLGQPVGEGYGSAGHSIYGQVVPDGGDGPR